jgi:hypothetical protein
MTGDSFNNWNISEGFSTLSTGLMLIKDKKTARTDKYKKLKGV